mmetsp:Transcript_528/g.1595  ORF Transcript_528/g.1595 Transcript_528/m.1595 type:complete len:202 (-) Transcript_528:306-911(-)
MSASISAISARPSSLLASRVASSPSSAGTPTSKKLQTLLLAMLCLALPPSAGSVDLERSYGTGVGLSSPGNRYAGRCSVSCHAKLLRDDIPPTPTGRYLLPHLSSNRQSPLAPDCRSTPSLGTSASRQPLKAPLFATKKTLARGAVVGDSRSASHAQTRTTTRAASFSSSRTATMAGRSRSRCSSRTAGYPVFPARSLWPG